MTRFVPVLVVCFAFGCAKSGTPQTAEQLEGRMSAAVQITSLNERDIAYASIADDAAASNEAAIVRRAIALMTSLNQRDTVAERSALTLLGRKNTEGATGVANLISSLNKRDAILAKIAKGQ